jgi:hypothetical protein
MIYYTLDKHVNVPSETREKPWSSAL